MQTISTALRNAINAGNPQRVLLVFDDTEFTNEDIVINNGLTLREEFNTDENLSIGSCPSSVISFELLNDEGQLADFEFGWFTAYLGARIDTGTPTEITRTYTEGGSSKTYAFSPLGVFYAEKPNVLIKKTISVTAYDQMLLLETDMPSAETLGITYPTTIADIYEAICTHLNITASSSQFLNYDLVVSAEPKELSKAKIREVIGWIAECACSIARFNRDGGLEFAWFVNPDVSYSEANYSDFVYSWYQTKAIDGLYCRDTDTSTDTIEGDDKTNNYLILDNPFLKGE